MKKSALAVLALAIGMAGIVPALRSQVAPAGAWVEETDAAVTFTAGWTQHDSWTRSWSGSAAYATTAGEVATFSFTGTSVIWIGARGPQTGIARLFLDGVFLAEVDTYSLTEEIRVPMFTVNDLANANHTLAIHVTGTANSAALNAFVVVDAFDTRARAVSRWQETDTDIVYTGAWSQGDTSRAWSAGIAALTAMPGARAQLGFTGTAIRVIGARGPQTGIARIYLDGAFAAEVDTYAPSERIQDVVYMATGLSNSSHTVTLEVTGNKNTASSSPLIVLDAFEVETPGRRYQDTHPSVALDQGWVKRNIDKAYSEGTTGESVIGGARVSFTFNGTGVTWIGARGWQTGIARLYLDGAFVGEIDTYRLAEAPQKALFTAKGLAAGRHVLVVEVTGRKNPASAYYWILADAFDVVP